MPSRLWYCVRLWHPCLFNSTSGSDLPKNSFTLVDVWLSLNSIPPPTLIFSLSLRFDLSPLEVAVWCTSEISLMYYTPKFNLQKRPFTLIKIWLEFPRGCGAVYICDPYLYSIPPPSLIYQTDHSLSLRFDLRSLEVMVRYMSMPSLFAFFYL